MKKQIALVCILSYLIFFGYTSNILADNSIPIKKGEIVEKEVKSEDSDENNNTEDLKVNDPNFKTYTYILDGKKYDFYMFKADMNDRRNYVDVKLADNKIGHLDYLGNMVKQADTEDSESQVLAGINGGLFNMGTGRQPIATLAKDGDFKYLYFKGAMANFTGDNNMFLSRNDYEVLFAVNDCWQEPYGFKSKFINQINYDPNGVGVLNFDYDGERFDRDMMVVEVVDNVVTQIYNRVPKQINPNSYLIISQINKSIKNIKIGDKIDYTYRSYDRSNPSITLPLQNLRTSLGSGPMILKDGKIAIDTKKDNLVELGIYNSRPRSMVGMTKDKQLYFVVAKNMNIYILTELAINLGMENALNLDGGGSSGLYVGNKYVYSQRPERKIANALILKRQKIKPIRIVINGKERFYDTIPYLYNDRTMLPLRGILEDLECKVTWDSQNEEVGFERYGKKYRVKKDSKTIYGENKNYEMDVPLLIQNGRSAISARYLSEILGGTVEWVAEEELVNIEIDSINHLYHSAKALYEQKDFDKAIETLNKVLAINEKHSSSFISLAKIYEDKENYDKAIDMYNKLIDIDDKNLISYSGKANIYEKKENFDKAIDMYKKILSFNDKDIPTLKKIASLYKESKEFKLAMEYFEQAYELAKDKEIASALLELYQNEFEKDDKNIQLVKKIALMYENLENIPSALKYYEEAYNIDEKDIEIIQKLALMYENSKDTDKAIKFYEKAYEIDENDINVLGKLASLYGSIGNTEDVIKYCKKLYAINDKDPIILKQLANVYESLSDKASALEYYEKLYQIDKSDFETTKKLADTYEFLEKYDMAIDYYGRAYKLNKESNLALSAIKIMDKKEDYETIIKFAKDNELIPSNIPQVYYYLAKSYKKTYDDTEAFNNFKIFLDFEDSGISLDAEFKKEALEFIDKMTENKNDSDNESNPKNNDDNQESEQETDKDVEDGNEY